MQVRAPAARPQIEWGLFKPAPSRNAGGGELGLGVRPHAIFLDDRAAAVAWDTDESRLRDDTAEVWLQRLCVQ